MTSADNPKTTTAEVKQTDNAPVSIQTALDQSTRPSLAGDPSLSAISTVTQPVSTPRSLGSVSPPTQTPATTTPTTNPFDDSAAAPGGSGAGVQPASTPPANPPTGDQGHNPEIIDPKVANLKAMFGDFDVVVLQSVLEECQGDENAALEILLGMSDPNYKPQAQPAQLSQMDLDEQLAQRLALEEQQQPNEGRPYAQHHYYSSVGGNRAPQPLRTQTYGRGGQNVSGGEPSPTSSGGFAAQANDIRDQFISFVNGVRGGAPGGNPPQTQSEQAGVQFRQQVNEMAESGKRTFANIVNRVKAKMNEGEAQGQPPQGNGEHWSTFSVNPSASQQGYQPTYAAPSNPPPQQSAPTTIQPAQTGGYSIAPPSAPLVSSLVDTSTASQPASSATGTDPAPRASFDTSKLGLKPKRPVSLIDANASKDTTRSRVRDDDEESLEYVKSPFEDR